MERVELDIDLERKRVDPENYENKRLQLDQKHQKFQKNLEKSRLKKWNNIKQKEIFPERILLDYNTAEKLDIKRKKMEEDSELHDFPKNLQNVSYNRQYCKIGTKRYSDVFKPFGSSTKEAPGNSQAIVDLKDIKSILLRDKNLTSYKIQNSPPDICTDSSRSGNAFSKVSLNIKSEKVFSTQDEELL